MDTTEDNPCVIVAVGVRICDTLLVQSLNQYILLHSLLDSFCDLFGRADLNSTPDEFAVCQVGFIWEDEQDLVMRFNCTVLMFDPTPGSGLGVTSRTGAP